MNVGVSQKAAILNNQGQVLVLLRGSSAPSNPLKWDLPGGDVDFGEDPTDSILREIKEETGLEISKLKVYDVEAHINDANDHWFTIAYAAKTDSRDVQISWEHDEYKWINPDEYIDLPNIPKILRFIENLKQ